MKEALIVCNVHYFSIDVDIDIAPKMGTQ